MSSESLMKDWNPTGSGAPQGKHREQRDTCTEGASLVHMDCFLSVGVAMNMVGRDSLEATKSFLISV